MGVCNITTHQHAVTNEAFHQNEKNNQKVATEQFEILVVDSETHLTLKTWDWPFADDGQTMIEPKKLFDHLWARQALPHCYCAMVQDTTGQFTTLEAATINIGKSSPSKGSKIFFTCHQWRPGTSQGCGFYVPAQWIYEKILSPDSNPSTPASTLAATPTPSRVMPNSQLLSASLFPPIDVLNANEDPEESLALPGPTWAKMAQASRVSGNLTPTKATPKGKAKSKTSNNTSNSTPQALPPSAPCSVTTTTTRGLNTSWPAPLAPASHQPASIPALPALFAPSLGGGDPPPPLYTLPLAGSLPPSGSGSADIDVFFNPGTSTSTKRAHQPSSSVSSTASASRSNPRPRLEKGEGSVNSYLPPSASGPFQGFSLPNVDYTPDEREALQAARLHPRTCGPPTDPGPHQYTFADLYGLLVTLDSPLGCDASALRNFIWRCPDCGAEVSVRYARDHWQTKNCGAMEM
ncbi:hypothetical protein FRC01_012963 [Tulasnella sp. 417]|nr:hypothetical protein FRC01_012963 [Tulasnella sp. 417]